MPSNQVHRFRFARSLFFLLLAFFAVKLPAQSIERLTLAVNQFAGTLSADEVRQTNFPFTDSLRIKWTNLPVGMVPRPGIRYGSLSDKSRLAFHRILVEFLSSQGYLKITSIMQLDDILNVLIQQAYDKGEMKADVLKNLQDLKWEHGNYYLAIWGKPSEKEPWGISFGGHHIALSFTAVGNALAVTPLFIGTDPAEVKSNKYAGWRVLSKEEDYGFSLINFLSESQRKTAILKQEVPHDIITNPKSSQRITSYYGISAKQFNADQKAILKILIEEYVHNFEHAKAHRLMDMIDKSGMDNIYFAWVGSLERDKPHYYIINGPDFLVEYDNFQGNGNHIHAILREKGNDFGEDILRNHYLSYEHKR